VKQIWWFKTSHQHVQSPNYCLYLKNNHISRLPNIYCYSYIHYTIRRNFVVKGFQMPNHHELYTSDYCHESGIEKLHLLFWFPYWRTNIPPPNLSDCVLILKLKYTKIEIFEKNQKAALKWLKKCIKYYREPLDWLSSNFRHGIIWRIRLLKPAWKAHANGI